MPWQTPTLQALRALNRDNVTAKLRSGPIIPNSVLRVMSDGNAGLAYLTLLYLNWLALQLMPDTAEKEWLDRFGNIWVGGRKAANFASGTALLTGIALTPVAAGTLYTVQVGSKTVAVQTTQAVTLGGAPTLAPIAALTPGQTLLGAGAVLNLASVVPGLSGTAAIAAFSDGAPEETDDQLRVRVLDRIREPPMGGDAFDYVEWALAFPGVTRAWCAPQEMGIGTVTVRFMMDDANAGPLTIDGAGRGHGGGFPEDSDVANVLAFMSNLRPVSIKDFFVEAPLPAPLNCTIGNLSESDADTQAAINASIAAMLAAKAAPASSLNGVLIPPTTIYSAWVSDAILNTPDVDYFDLTMADFVMPNNGSMAVLGNIIYA
jgi:uncharacterized phage protein gp47/JayE